MRTRFAIALAAVPLVLAACGDDDTKGPAATSPAVTTPAATTPATTPAPTTPAPTTPAATMPAPTGPQATTPGAAGSTAAGAVDIELDEFTIEESGTIAAGEVTFNVKNVGQRTHEFAVFKGTDYAQLPHQPNGAVDETALGAANIVGRTDKLDSGETASITLNLPAGQYVLICNLGAGPNSHAAKGQHVAITVA